MAIVMGTYYGVFVPQIVNVQLNYDPVVKYYVDTILYLLFFCNGIVNPIVYGWLSPDFNAAYRAIFGLKPKQRNISQSTVTSSIYTKADGPEVPTIAGSVKDVSFSQNQNKNSRSQAKETDNKNI